MALCISCEDAHVASDIDVCAECSVSWSLTDIEELVNSGSGDSPKGCDCEYIKATDKAGLKLVLMSIHDADGVEEQARKMYELHVLAYEIGIGPKVWGFQIIGDRCGWFVEHCEMVDWREQCVDSLKACFGAVIKTAAAAGYRLVDLHRNNVGCKLDGTPVIVDGGCLGTSFSLEYLDIPERNPDLDADAEYKYWCDRLGNYMITQCYDYKAPSILDAELCD